VALLLGGCVKIYIVGHTDDWSDYMTGSGSADPLGGEGSAEIHFAKLGTTCVGKFRDYAPGKARGEILCDDQRIIKTESWALSLSSGKGYGTDQLGHRGEVRVAQALGHGGPAGVQRGAAERAAEHAAQLRRPCAFAARAHRLRPDDQNRRRPRIPARRAEAHGRGSGPV